MKKITENLEIINSCIKNPNLVLDVDFQGDLCAIRKWSFRYFVKWIRNLFDHWVTNQVHLIAFVTLRAFALHRNEKLLQNPITKALSPNDYQLKTQTNNEIADFGSKRPDINIGLLSQRICLVKPDSNCDLYDPKIIEIAKILVTAYGLSSTNVADLFRNKEKISEETVKSEIVHLEAEIEELNALKLESEQKLGSLPPPSEDVEKMQLELHEVQRYLELKKKHRLGIAIRKTQKKEIDELNALKQKHMTKQGFSKDKKGKGDLSKHLQTHEQALLTKISVAQHEGQKLQEEIQGYTDQIASNQKKIAQLNSLLSDLQGSDAYSEEYQLAKGCQNPEEAFLHYLKAANQGHSEAAFQVGKYHEGQGKNANPKEAFTWYSRAAQGNCLPAIQKCAEVCEKDGLLVQASYWLKLYISLNGSEEQLLKKMEQLSMKIVANQATPTFLMKPKEYFPIGLKAVAALLHDSGQLGNKISEYVSLFNAIHTHEASTKGAVLDQKKAHIKYDQLFLFVKGMFSEDYEIDDGKVAILINNLLVSILKGIEEYQGQSVAIRKSFDKEQIVAALSIPPKDSKKISFKDKIHPSIFDKHKYEVALALSETYPLLMPCVFGMPFIQRLSPVFSLITLLVLNRGDSKETDDEILKKVSKAYHKGILPSYRSLSDHHRKAMIDNYPELTFLQNQAFKLFKAAPTKILSVIGWIPLGKGPRALFNKTLLNDMLSTLLARHDLAPFLTFMDHCLKFMDAEKSHLKLVHGKAKDSAIEESEAKLAECLSEVLAAGVEMAAKMVSEINPQEKFMLTQLDQQLRSYKHQEGDNILESLFQQVILPVMVKMAPPEKTTKKEGVKA